MAFNFLKDLFDGKKRPAKTDITRRFELLGRIGQGSMSRVWRARDTQGNRIVALKVLDKEKTRRFESRFPPELKKPSEGEVALTLNHPNIVKTFEWGVTTDDEQFLVMEFIDGLGLSYLVDVQNEMMQKHRVSLMIQLGEAIHYFHDQKWIHRDICPRNIMVTDTDHQIKLIDFGLVVPNTPPFQAPGNRTGTANYMAPELIKRMRTDQRIDIFSFATTCFEMYTRRHPWEAAETIEAVLNHINSPPLDIREAVPGIDEQIATAIMKGLEVDPHNRWPTIDPMIYQFREANARLNPAARQKAKRTVGISMAEDQPERPASKRKPEVSTSDTSGHSADDKSSVTKEPKRPAPVRGTAGSKPGIRLDDDVPAGDAPVTKSPSPKPAIRLAEEEETFPERPVPKKTGTKPDIALAPDEPPPTLPDKPKTNPPPTKKPGIRLVEDNE